MRTRRFILAGAVGITVLGAAALPPTDSKSHLTVSAGAAAADHIRLLDEKGSGDFKVRFSPLESAAGPG
jgi:hypothetical protein